MLTKIGLWTASKQFVADAYVLPMNPLPEVVFWGTRVFIRGEPDDRLPPRYFEGLMVPAFDTPQGPRVQPAG